MATQDTGDQRTWQGQSAATTGKDPDRIPADLPTPAAPALKDQAAQLGRKASDGARDLASKAQSTAQDRIERSRQDAATTLSTVASTLLNSGSQLRDGDQPMAGEYVERAARQIERVADYVQRADVREMMNEVEDFARRRPAVFIGSAFAVGLLAARFLKSSREGEERSRDRASDRLTDREVPSTVVMEPRPGSDLESWPETI